MPDVANDGLLAALLESWERSNRILVNLLRALPGDALDVRAAAGSPTVRSLFAHMHFVRLIFVTEDVPELPVALPAREWDDTPSQNALAMMLDASAVAVRDAVERRVREGRAMDEHYDHPVLFLQHMIWHEGYHHGQIKLALKLAGRPVDDRDIGPGTWGVWMRKTTAQPAA